MFIIVGTSVIPAGGYLRGTEKMHIKLYMKTRLKFGNAYKTTAVQSRILL